MATIAYERLWHALELSEWPELMELFTDDVEVIFQDARFAGSKPLEDYLRAVMTALPDLTHEIDDIVESADGQALAGIVTARGTHATAVEMLGKTFDLTGRGSIFQAVDFLWLESGRIAKWWAMYDPLERFKSLGLSLNLSDKPGP